MALTERLAPALVAALTLGAGDACAHADGALPGLRTEAVLGMGSGSGTGIPVDVTRALKNPRLRQALSRPASSPATLLTDDKTLANPTPDGDPAETSTAKEIPDRYAKADLRPKFKERPGYPLSERGGYKMSCYWLAWESEYASEPYDTDIYTRHGQRIGRFPRTYVFELKMEGSGILRDGRVLNYDGTCAYGVGTCFTTLDPREHPLGQGGQRRALLPFKSVAVDPRFVPLGTTLFLPELRGLELPDGTTHDGCVRADDTGGNIRRRELDFFVESYDNYKLIEDRLWNEHRVTPYIEEPRCDYLRTFDRVIDRKSESTDWAQLHTHKPPPSRPAKGKKGGAGSPHHPSKAKARPAAKNSH